MTAMRTLLVDDHKLFLDAITPMLNGVGVKVIGSVGDGRSAMDAVTEQRPDLILLDLRLPDGDGIELGVEILRRFPEVKILAVTSVRDPRLMERALKAGIHGFLTKDSSMADLIRGIQAVLGGQSVMPSRLVSQLVGSDSADQRHAEMLASHLTGREREVLRLLVEGENSDAIAASLGISTHTARTHVQNVLVKLQVHSRLEAVAYATRFGLIAGNA